MKSTQLINDLHSITMLEDVDHEICEIAARAAQRIQELEIKYAGRLAELRQVQQDLEDAQATMDVWEHGGL